MKNTSRLITLIYLLTLSFGTHAQVSIVKNYKPTSRIILANDSETDRTAANLLQTFVKRISGATLPILPRGIHERQMNIRKGDIIISNQKTDKTITEDGFRLHTENGSLHIVGGAGKGSIYGVVTLLEQCFGVSYWGEHECSFEQQKDLVVPLLNITDNPAFRYRQSQFYGMHTDSIYKLWNRLEEPREVFADGLWVHTFDKLLPSAVYGEEHPEYYSFFNAERHPGKASQWCLSNPQLFEVVSQRIDSIFKANPEMHLISVSQNDGNYTHCTCEDCKKVDDYEGALSGSMIHFLNKLAARFPDKEFSTLAYLYTMHPPKHVKPLPNVNIMLCDIDCNREVSLTENASGREFVKAMEGWSKITNNIFVWDYGINFDNMVAPFPNFHILQDNIKLFKKNHATMHFSQIASSRGGDFAELRTYLVSKLMWNPEANVDSLTQRFLNGYYGAAAPFLYQYTKIMEGALMGSGNRLWIYDSPVSHKMGMLKPELLRRYQALFDKAESAVAQDELLLGRVQRSRLPLQYAELEIIRTEPEKELESLNQKLDLFELRVKKFDVATLNERNNSPVEYCELYRKRYLPQQRANLAYGAKIEYLVPPSGKYAALGETALTDNLFGGSSFVESWVGWEGIDGAFIIDLGEEKSFSTIETDFLHQLGQWILLPTQVRFAISSDKEKFTLLEEKNLPEDRSVQVKFVQVKHQSPQPLKARYIKIEITGTKKCPHWHYGVGHPCWFFIDEVTVCD